MTSFASLSLTPPPCPVASGWVANAMWLRVGAGLTPVISGIMLALSGAMAAFCLYNLAAGGNPPPSAKKEAAQ